MNIDLTPAWHCDTEHPRRVLDARGALVCEASSEDLAAAICQLSSMSDAYQRGFDAAEKIGEEAFMRYVQQRQREAAARLS